MLLEAKCCSVQVVLELSSLFVVYADPSRNYTEYSFFILSRSTYADMILIIFTTYVYHMYLMCTLPMCTYVYHKYHMCTLPVPTIFIVKWLVLGVQSAKVFKFENVFVQNWFSVISFCLFIVVAPFYDLFLLLLRQTNKKLGRRSELAFNFIWVGNLIWCCWVIWLYCLAQASFLCVC